MNYYVKNALRDEMSRRAFFPPETPYSLFILL